MARPTAIDESALENITDPGRTCGRDPLELTRGTTVYLLLNRLGAGGMGGRRWSEVQAALMELRRQVRWRSSEPDHLRRRVRALIQLGHLPLGATIDTLAEGGRRRRGRAGIPVPHRRGRLPGLLSRMTGYPWMVMFDMHGAVETATPLSNPVAYFGDDRFVRLGMARDLASRFSGPERAR